MDRRQFEARGGRVETVKLPGGGDLTLRTLTTREFLLYQAQLPVSPATGEESTEEKKDFQEQVASYIEILSYSLCDHETLESLGREFVEELPWSVLTQLAEKAFLLQAVSDDDLVRQKKDSAPTPVIASSSN